MARNYRIYFFFFFNDTATTEIYTLSLHDALPIYQLLRLGRGQCEGLLADDVLACVKRRLHLRVVQMVRRDRKSTRLNSSHQIISYAVFCLKKKNSRFQTTLVDHLVIPTARYNLIL